MTAPCQSSPFCGLSSLGQCFLLLSWSFQIFCRPICQFSLLLSGPLECYAWKVLEVFPLVFLQFQSFRPCIQISDPFWKECWARRERLTTSMGGCLDFPTPLVDEANVPSFHIGTRDLPQVLMLGWHKLYLPRQRSSSLVSFSRLAALAKNPSTESNRNAGSEHPCLTLIVFCKTPNLYSQPHIIT